MANMWWNYNTDVKLQIDYQCGLIINSSMLNDIMKRTSRHLNNLNCATLQTIVKNLALDKQITFVVDLLQVYLWLPFQRRQIHDQLACICLLQVR